MAYRIVKSPSGFYHLYKDDIWVDIAMTYWGSRYQLWRYKRRKPYVYTENTVYEE